MKGLTIDDISVGMTETFTKTLGESDIYLYAGITGDFNPVHIDETYAKETVFKTRIAHGLLTAGFISTVLGTKLPGPGAVYVKQELKFLAPVNIGDTLTAKAEVTEVIKEKNRVVLKTTISNQNGKTVLDGEAVLSPMKKKKE